MEIHMPEDESTEETLDTLEQYQRFQQELIEIPLTEDDDAPAPAP